jgi:hypothetical protein
MHRPGADPDDVQMSDVLCDFCRRAWTEDVAMVEGHRGSCICGRCLTLAWVEVMRAGGSSVPSDFRCTMCLESGRDRAALERAGEPGWQSPIHGEAFICRRCVEQAARVLGRDPDSRWVAPA